MGWSQDASRFGPEQEFRAAVTAPDRWRWWAWEFRAGAARKEGWGCARRGAPKVADCRRSETLGKERWRRAQGKRRCPRVGAAFWGWRRRSLKRSSPTQMARSWCRSGRALVSGIAVRIVAGVARAMTRAMGAGAGGRWIWGRRRATWRPTLHAWRARCTRLSSRRSRGPAMTPGLPAASKTRSRG